MRASRPAVLPAPGSRYRIPPTCRQERDFCRRRLARRKRLKALLWLNGGAAIALLTFFGNRGKMLTTASADAIDPALIGFGIGTVASVLMFAFAYFTQLHYSNEGFTKKARSLHWLTYIPLLFALGGFIGGIWFAKIAVVTALT
jgi:hypothetical protein